MSETTYLVVSDIELIGPDKGIENLKLGEDTLANIVTGLHNAELEAMHRGQQTPRYGVTIYKVVEVAHYKPYQKI